MFKQRNSVFIAVLHLEVTMCLFYSLSAIFVGETGTFQRHVIFRLKLLGSNVSACRQTTDPQQITTAEFVCRQ
jgi:hypothetical protein